MLRQSRCWQQAAERYASIVLLFTKETRMSVVDMVMRPSSKLIVAVLQLLDAVLKYLR